MTTGRTRIAGAVALLAAALVAGLLLAGGAQGDDARVAWKDAQVFSSGVKTDRILAGQLENTSLRDIEIDVEDIRVLDAEGREVQSATRFLATFAHGIFPWSQRPEVMGDFERRRLGEIVTLKPGRSAPITLSWRLKAGAAPPARVDFGAVELDLPAAAAR